MADQLYSGAERRVSARFPIDAKVKLVHDGGTFEGRGKDFNDTSVRVVHDSALPVGTKVTLHVVDEAGLEVVIKGEITRVNKVSETGEIHLVVTRKG